MNDEALQHTKLDGIADYAAALDTVCQMAQHNLYLFENDFDGLGFNSEVRYEVLRHFLLSNPAHRLFVLAHNTHYLSTRCPRMMMLLSQFGTGMSIRQTPKSLQHLTEPFAVADEEHYVRRFHFDDPRGILAKYDPSSALILKARFLEMWGAAHQIISPSKLGL